MKTPWDAGVGWQYDLLRCLPHDVAKGVWAGAWDRMVETWRKYVLVGLILTVPVTMWGIWHMFGAFGLRGLSRLAAEVVAYRWLVVFPYRVANWCVVTPLMRPFIADELLKLAEQEFSRTEHRPGG